MLDLAHRPNRPAAMKHLRGSNIPDQTDSPQDQEPLWDPPILQITATEGLGIDELVESIHHHKEYLKKSGRWKQKEADRLKRDLENLIRHRLVKNWQESLDHDQFNRILEDVIQRKYPPLKAVEILLENSKQ